ncbi:MAG: helicase-associated domain-containing protein, partial [Leptospiraceae bacterium]|nr:helicase-associated domain-containing protein [Leptospiraceae bacterium]
MSKPLIVQSDKTMLLEVDNQEFEECRNVISRFAELEKSPEYLHTYRISSLSLWNAASTRMSAEEIVEALHKYARYSVPKNVINEIQEQISRYGKVKLVKDETGELAIISNEKGFIQEIGAHRSIQPYIQERIGPDKIHVKKEYRGHIKQALIKIGFPVEDLAGYDEGNKFPFNLRPETVGGNKFGMRDYQRASVEVFHAGGTNEGGSGVVVLPCGAGKTIVGIGVMQII